MHGVVNNLHVNIRCQFITNLEVKHTLYFDVCFIPQQAQILKLFLGATTTFKLHAQVRVQDLHTKKLR